MTRRGFLGVSVLSIVVGMAAYVDLSGVRTAFGRRVRAAYLSRLAPTLVKGPTGPASEATLKALLAAGEAILDGPFDLRRYEAFFRWRSENLPGYCELYDRFRATVDELAHRSWQRDFALCDRANRRQLVADVCPVVSRASRWQRLQLAFLDSDRLRFREYIVREVLHVFLRTDAFTRLGYEGWPGSPRGLDRYTQRAVAPVTR